MPHRRRCWGRSYRLGLGDNRGISSSQMPSSSASSRHHAIFTRPQMPSSGIRAGPIVHGGVHVVVGSPASLQPPQASSLQMQSSGLVVVAVGILPRYNRAPRHAQGVKSGHSVAVAVDLVVLSARHRSVDGTRTAASMPQGGRPRQRSRPRSQTVMPSASAAVDRSSTSA